VLQGRDAERARITALVDGAVAGRGGALVLRGQPGVGKSSLLADIAADVGAAHAGPVAVLRTQGIESESPLAFAALQRLLRPVRDHAGQLPGPQEHALRAAFGEVAGGDVDRFMVFLGALNLLAEAAEQQPVLAVVDDAHWLDDASAAALLFVARRLENERVALLFAAREGDVRTFDSGDLPSLPLGGVDAAAAARLLGERAGVVVPRDVSDVLVAGTGGNPLALVELADSLPAEQLSGVAPLPARLPLTEGVERAFLDRYRRLDTAARTVLLVAAADDSGRVTVVRSASGQLGGDDEGWAAAERSGLLRVRDVTLELRHPLVRSAVYGGATSTERRRVHRALAGALTGAADADRRAWHLAASVEEPDEAVVAELDRAADRAVGRGGHEAAAAAWERAAELSTDADERARRLYWSARSAWLGAQPGRARALADAAAASAVDPCLLADIRRQRARIEWNTGVLDVGHRMVLEAAAEVAPVDPRRAREMAMFAAALAAFGARSGTGLDPASLVPEPGPGAPARERCFSALLLGLDAVGREDWYRATTQLRAALDLAEDLADDDQDLLPNLGIAALHIGDDQAAFRFDDRLLTRARSTGALVMILYALTRRSVPQLATGQWSAAAAAVAESLPLAESTGQPGLTALPTAVLAVLAAWHGEDAVDRHVAAVERLAAEHPLGILGAVVFDLLRWARGVQAWPTPATALRHLEQIAHPVSRRLAAVDRIEAAVRAGRAELAQTWIDDLATFAEPTGSAWAHAAAEHGRALLADGSEAEGHFGRALQWHERSLRAPDRARTELAYGEFLRRTRRRVDARTHLRAALETFEDLGAEPWAERARAELRASGETARRRDASAVPELTPQELQVATLVRQGMSNRDAAAQLFLSPRTIDFHLRNVFAKLGVASRTELAALPLD
jgi:DNA-binding CsgD family transcriptional regulator